MTYRAALHKTEMDFMIVIEVIVVEIKVYEDTNNNSSLMTNCYLSKNILSYAELISTLKLLLFA